MSKKLTSRLKKIGIAVLNFLGISSLISCLGDGGGIGSLHGGGGMIAMYGVPGNFFEFDGTVTGDADKDGIAEAISGIKISVKSISDDSKDEPVEVYSTLQDENTADSSEPDLIEIKTNSEGKYSFQIHNFSSNALVYEVTFEDIDGELNGSFESLTETFDFTEQDKVTDKKGWNKNFRVSKDITLQSKK